MGLTSIPWGSIRQGSTQLGGTSIDPAAAITPSRMRQRAPRDGAGQRYWRCGNATR
jgi:hypothetical protein